MMEVRCCHEKRRTERLLSELLESPQKTIDKMSSRYFNGGDIDD